MFLIQSNDNVHCPISPYSFKGNRHFEFLTFWFDKNTMILTYWQVWICFMFHKMFEESEELKRASCASITLRDAGVWLAKNRPVYQSGGIVHSIQLIPAIVNISNVETSKWSALDSLSLSATFSANTAGKTLTNPTFIASQCSEYFCIRFRLSVAALYQIESISVVLCNFTIKLLNWTGKKTRKSLTMSSAKFYFHPKQCVLEYNREIGKNNNWCIKAMKHHLLQ